MTIEQAVVTVQIEFKRVGVNLLLSQDSLTLSVRRADIATRFRIPDMVDATHSRLPGWYLAGIWDMLQLPDLHEPPNDMLLQYWGFAYESSSWRMHVGEIQLLVYTPSSGKLCLQNYSAGSTTDLGVFPTKSVFHAQQLLEENGWFRGQSSVKTLVISDYLVRQ